MISTEQLKEIINEASKKGHAVSVRDVAYAILCMHFDDSLVAYKSLFGNDYDYHQERHETYDNTAMMSYIKAYVEMIENGGKKSKSDDISFEENKAEIINLIKETKDKEARGEIDAKQSLDLQTKLRVTLNDKFRVQSEEVEQRVVVTPKFNGVCSYCSREIHVPTKEELMKKYNLIENNNEY